MSELVCFECRYTKDAGEHEAGCSRAGLGGLELTWVKARKPKPKPEPKLSTANAREIAEAEAMEARVRDLTRAWIAQRKATGRPSDAHARH